MVFCSNCDKSFDVGFNVTKFENISTSLINEGYDMNKLMLEVIYVLII